MLYTTVSIRMPAGRMTLGTRLIILYSLQRRYHLNVILYSLTIRIVKCYVYLQNILHCNAVNFLISSLYVTTYIFYTHIYYNILRTPVYTYYIKLRHIKQSNDIIYEL